MIGNGLRIGGDSAPKVRQHPVQIIDGFKLANMRASKQHRAGTEERLDVMRHVAQRGPYVRRNIALASKPRKGRFKAHAARSSTGAPHSRRNATAASTDRTTAT